MAVVMPAEQHDLRPSTRGYLIDESLYPPTTLRRKRMGAKRMLEDAKTPNSPAWWLLRLGARLERDQGRFDSLDAYWRGNHPVAFGNHKMREAYRRFQAQSKTNFCSLVAESVIERLRVTGFRAGGDGSDILDKQAWGWWQTNHLDADSGLVHRAAIVMSRAYVIVGEHPDVPGQPMVTGEDPRQVIHESAPGRRRQLLAALKTWWDDPVGRQLAVLYLPDRVHYFRTEQQSAEATAQPWTAAKWEVDTSSDYPDGTAVNTLGEVPVVPFLNRPDLSGQTLGEFEDVISVQDRINTEVLDRMVISAMQAYRQRWATGVDLTDENGNPSGGFDPGADLLWNVADDNAKFGEFSPVDLVGVLKAVEADVQHLAAITRTPPHYLLGAMINISGDALGAAETGLTSKVSERSQEFGESWEMVYQLAGKVRGQSVPDDCEVIWADPQFRTLTEMAAANVQLVTAGVPWRTRMALLDFTPSQIDRMQTERVSDAMITSALAPPAAVGPPAPGGQGGAAVPASAAARAAQPANA
ncbi:MAG: phage portal protein [Mycobacterium sp.]